MLVLLQKCGRRERVLEYVFEKTTKKSMFKLRVGTVVILKYIIRLNYWTRLLMHRQCRFNLMFTTQVGYSERGISLYEEG
jgi:glycyl-tRNA synthetase (class II)